MSVRLTTGMAVATSQEPGMRLAPHERQALSEIFYRLLGNYPDAVVLLFGSRIDRAQRGGDLDLLIVSPAAAQNAYRVRKALSMAIQKALGDQQVDIVVSPGLQDPQLPAFIQLAILDGVQIWP